MISRQDIFTRRDEIVAVALRHGAHDVRVFGSVARGDQGPDSDLDLIVRFDPDRSLFDHGALICDLEELLGVKVDVVSERGMRDRVRSHAEKEAIAL